MKNILIVDDDVDTSLRYKKWLEDEDFILTLINDPHIIERNLILKTMILFLLVLECLFFN
jgi:hypothetical protein